MSPGLPWSSRRVIRLTLGAFLLATWLLSGVLALSPELHLWLHSDANTPNHECFITQANQGSCLAEGSTSITPRPPLDEVASLRCPEFRPPFRFDSPTAPSRAPPGASVSLPVAG